MMNNENTMTKEKTPKKSRREYQAEWQKKRYWKDKAYRDAKLKKAADSYAQMSEKEKKEYSDKQKGYRSNKVVKELSGVEKKEDLERKREYYRGRRDANVVSHARDKYDAMNDAQKAKFLDKLARYRDIISDFATEIAHRESTNGE
jgi:hypothetical protein